MPYTQRPREPGDEQTSIGVRLTILGGWRETPFCIPFDHLALLALAQSRIAGSQTVETAAGATVGAGLVSATGIVDDVIEKAGNEANYVVFNAAVQLRLLIESLRLSARDVINESFDSLDDSQKQIFDNVQKGLVSLQIALEQPIEDARQTVETVQQIAADTTPWPDEPTVLRSSPSVIGPSERDELAFVVRGINLDEADPKLIIGNTEASRVELQQQQATFVIDSEFFTPEDTALKFVTGRISLVVENCDLFWLLCSDGRKDFEIVSLVLPKQLGEVYATYNTKSEERVYHDSLFTRRFSKSTGDLTRYKCQKYSQGPHQPGYFIDPTSIRPVNYKVPCEPFVRIFGARIPVPGCVNGQATRPGEHGKAGHRWSFLDKSPGGFSLEICVQSQMHTAFKKRNGEQVVNLGWREYKLDDVISPDTSLEQQSMINWGDAIELKLPGAAHALTVRIEYFDGTSTLFAGSYADHYVDAGWNNATKQLILRPRKIWSIKEIY